MESKGTQDRFNLFIIIESFCGGKIIEHAQNYFYVI
jgi:hypothetical protein